MRLGFRIFAAWTFSVFLCVGCFSAEPTPFQQFVQARALDDDLDSVHLVWEWAETEEGKEDSPPFGVKTDERAVFRDGIVFEAQTMHGIGGAGIRARAATLFYYFKDGYVYSRKGSLRHPRKAKHQAGPIPAGIDPVARGVVRTPLEERFVAGQRREGDVLHFTVDTEALNAHLEETSVDERWQEAAFEVELNGEGRISKITAAGKYTFVPEGGTPHFRHRGSLEVLQRGGVAVGFPSDLDTYEESE